MLARRTNVTLKYNNISADDVAKYLQDFKYVDVASGSSDSISVNFSDKDRKWRTSWFPRKGDKLTPSIILQHWDDPNAQRREYKCGTFVVDDFGFEGSPCTCTIDAVAMPSTSGFHATERTNTYEKTTLKEIAKKIAARNGLSLSYHADSPISISSAGQDKQTDSSFFASVCTKYGLAFKVYNNKLVVFDEGLYERQRPAATLTPLDIDPDWSWDTTIAGTYTGVKYQYTDKKSEVTYNCYVGGKERTLTVDDDAGNETEARLIALGKLNDANKRTTTMSVSMRSPAWAVSSTQCVQMSGFGKIDGKYYIEKATHTVDGNGTKVELFLRKVESRYVLIDGKVMILNGNWDGTNYRKGERVRVRLNARSASGKVMPPRVYTTLYIVLQVSGGNVTIGSSTAVLDTFRAEDLYRDRPS